MESVRVLLVEPLGVLRASLGDQSAVVLQNRYFVRYLRLQTIYRTLSENNIQQNRERNRNTKGS